ncbi:hypothetical protein DRO42_01145 [Candidatus Bathyarchaeota archaeon]|nr:MAG: hypothetical protein DRO42_01145 [Candidatus Bathyarchaeota archaeon]
MTGRLVTEIMDTRSLRELLTVVEKEISHYLSQKKEYSERLGNFLRESEEKYGNEDWFKQLSLGEKLPKGKAKAKKKKGGKKKKKKGKKGTPDEWVPFQSMFLSSSVQGEAELMFEAIEAITTKIEELEEAKRSIEELRNVGLGDEASYIVLLLDGVPRKVFIKPTGAEAIPKFTFSKGFTIVRTLQPQAPS